jgi:hypothetical protein
MILGEKVKNHAFLAWNFMEVNFQYKTHFHLLPGKEFYLSTKQKFVWAPDMTWTCKRIGMRVFVRMKTPKVLPFL